MTARALRRRLLQPFRTRVFFFEHTRVEVRSFPPRFRYGWVPSVQNRVDRADGLVVFDPGTYVLYETVSLRGGDNRLQGASSVREVE